MTQIRIEAEDYNSYSDSSNGNEGGAYRSDNVDIESTSDVGGGYNVGWIESGESLTYNFNVTESGTYKLVSRVASARSGDHSFQVSIAGQETRLNLINTGGWQNWKNVESTQNFTLNAGSNTLRVDMIGDLFNINYFDLVKVEGDSGSTASNPDNGGSNENSGEESPTPNSSTNSLRIEAEDYNSYSDNTNGNLGGAYRSDNVDIQNTSDVGGGYNVGWIQSGESLTYNFNLAESGTYKLVSRVASAEGGDHSFQVSLGGQQTQLNLGNTGGWQSWTDVESTQNFTLNAGSNTLRVDMLGNSFNINYFDLVKVEGDSGNTASNPDNGGSNGNSGGESPTPNSSTNSLRIEAEDYNSYSDNTNGNLGGAYRSDNVDIQNTSDVGGGYNVGWIQSGESLTYNFNLAESGTYKLVSRVASAEGGDHSFQVSLGGQQTQLNLGNTGDWQSWIDVESTQNFTLNAGSNTLEVDMLGNSFNINYFDLVKVEGDSGNTNTPNPTPQVQQVNLDLGNIFEAGTGTGNQTYNGSNAIDTVRYADVNSGFGIEGNLETGVVKYKSAPASNDTITIMPFGDSITDGYMASDTAGYRDDLWNTLTSEGYNIDMVGSKSEGAGDFDKDHSGYSGYRIDEIANLADGLINTYDPDVVFLMIGTNDILQDYNLDTAPDRLSSLIDTITDASPDTEVFVASIPPDKNSARQERVVDYNAQIPGIVEEKQNQGKKVTYVDMSSQLDTGDLEDDVHPTPEGNQKIADVWSDAFRNHYGQPNTSSDISPDNLNNIDNLIGTTYDDTLTGNAGNNTIIGGNGYDYLAGGSGSDKFLIASGQETDTIIDFQVGEDLIVLDGLSYGQLTIASGSSYGYNSNDTVIINNNNNSEQLAILTGVQSNTVNANSFGIV